MRGSLSLFGDIFEPEQVETTGVKRQGRSATLDAKRNCCMIDRYYYLANFTNDRYHVIIENLSAQFFLSPIRIIDVLSKHSDNLRALKKENPPKQYFKNKWPHLVW